MSTQLSVDLLDRASALLGGIARMVARSGDISERQLDVLLLGADLQGNAQVREELLRWVVILKHTHGETDEEMQQAAAEALMLRGVGEGPALLAVSTVGGTSITTSAVEQEATVERIVVDPPSLELGPLRPGERTTAQITVHGGRGTVQAESDRVRVEPMRFGPDTTVLEVHIEPVPEGMLYTSLRLLSVGGAVEVPVTVQWTEGPLSQAPLQESTGTRSAELPSHHGPIGAATGSGTRPPEHNVKHGGPTPPASRLIGDTQFWAWGQVALPPDKMRFPCSIALADRQIVVLDRDSQRIQCYDTAGDLLDQRLDLDAVGGLRRPTQIAIDSQRHLYVLDDKRIIEVAPGKKPSVRWNGAGHPSADDFKGFTVDSQGNTNPV